MLWEHGEELHRTSKNFWAFRCGVKLVSRVSTLQVPKDLEAEQFRAAGGPKAVGLSQAQSAVDVIV